MTGVLRLGEFLRCAQDDRGASLLNCAQLQSTQDLQYPFQYV
jgi:hypothetical protein